MNYKPLTTNLANELARERNREAAERTLMAWIRTLDVLVAFMWHRQMAQTPSESTRQPSIGSCCSSRYVRVTVLRSKAQT